MLGISTKGMVETSRNISVTEQDNVSTFSE